MLKVFSQASMLGSAGTRRDCPLARVFGTLATLLLIAGLTACGSGVNTFAAPDTASLTLSTASLTFGSVTTGTSVTQHVMLSNEGTGPVQSLSLSLSDPTDFAVGSSCGSTLAADASCTLTVTFQPASAGSLSTTLTLRSNASNSPQTLQITGTGSTLPLPQATISSSSLVFGNVFVGAAAAAVVTLANSGSAVLQITGFALSDTLDFAATSTCGSSLAPAASCTFTLTFRPQARASFASSFTVTDNAGAVPGSTQAVALTGVAIPQIGSITNFGDSITCGYYALPQDGTGYVLSTHGYAGVLDAALAVPAQNLCRAGDQAADMARIWVYPSTQTPSTTPRLGMHQLYTVLIGTNDTGACGNSAGCQANWLDALTGSLAWLALPVTDKTLPAAITNRTGTWTSDLGGIGIEATGPGATLTFPVTQTIAGRTLYVGYRPIDASSAVVGSASVLVDGAPAAAISESNPNTQPVSTQNGTHDTFYVAAIPLGAVGQHTVTIVTTSASTAFFTFVWAGVSSGNYASSLSAPRVLLGTITQSPSASFQVGVNTYNALLTALATQLDAEGMDIELLPTGSALDVSTDYQDILHPNTAGHLKLAAVFEGVL